jgi:redox-sensitive bicupin YhaK (pirin superfamily)
MRRWSFSAARAILVASRPLREPVAKYGPFVMNTREELRQAFEDFQNGRF